jgi:hypothetical protein
MKLMKLMNKGNTHGIDGKERLVAGSPTALFWLVLTFGINSLRAGLFTLSLVEKFLCGWWRVAKQASSGDAIRQARRGALEEFHDLLIQGVEQRHLALFIVFLGHLLVDPEQRANIPVTDGLVICALVLPRQLLRGYGLGTCMWCFFMMIAVPAATLQPYCQPWSKCTKATIGPGRQGLVSRVEGRSHGATLQPLHVSMGTSSFITH